MTNADQIPQVLLWDVDGTLLQSNDAHTRAWVEAFHEFGLRVRYDQVRPLIGMGADQILPAIAKITEDENQGKQIAQRRGEIFRDKYLPGLAPYLRVRDLILETQVRGFQSIVVTSSSEKDLQGLLEKARVDDLLPLRTNSDDVENSKPAPDLVEVALKKMEALPSQAILIGDTIYDMQAASRAGVTSLGLTCGGWSREDLMAAGASWVFEDPADLLEHLDQAGIVLH